MRKAWSRPQAAPRILSPQRAYISTFYIKAALREPFMLT
jgi:hypothetical protein